MNKLTVTDSDIQIGDKILSLDGSVVGTVRNVVYDIGLANATRITFDDGYLDLTRFDNVDVLRDDADAVNS